MFANFMRINKSISSCEGISSNNENVTSLVRSISDISFEDKISPETTSPRHIISNENDFNMIRILPIPRTNLGIKEYVAILECLQQNKLKLRKENDNETDPF